MVVDWNKDLSVFVPEIDEQHQELLRRLDVLVNAFSSGKAIDEIKGVIAFLEEYVVHHFRTEERYMEIHNYPAYAGHKLEHEKFVAEVNKLKTLLEKRGVSLSLALRIETTLILWLLQHIKKVDRAMGQFLKDRIF